MPFFDLFKNKSKENHEFGDPKLQQNRVNAAIKFMGIFDKYFGGTQGSHVGTVISTAAWLTGTSLYRSLGYTHQEEPGTVILSDKVNEELPKLLNLFMFFLFQNGIRLKPNELVLETPESYKPLKTITQIQEEFQDEYNAIMKSHGLDYLNGARAGVVVCSMLVQFHCLQRKEMDPKLAAGMIVMGITTGAKTTPPPLGDKPKTGAKKMSRLVLGEPDAVREEALATGAIYIELAPGTLKELRQTKIDPYLIYEEGVREQIKERIARIDFVKVNVDELFEEWRFRPLTQASIHVRLIIWLKNNASTYGYEQKGNSWVLK
jgi:hypothetical protein